MSLDFVKAGNDASGMREALGFLLAPHTRAGWRLVDAHGYRGTDGAIRYLRVRLTRRAGYRQIGKLKTSFQSLRHDGQRWCLGEPPVPPEGRMLYQLNLLHETDATWRTWIVPDEVSAQAMYQLGMLATSCGEGIPVSAADWTPLRGRRVHVWPSHGRAGQRFAAELMPRLAALGCTIDLIDVARLGLSDGHGPREWLELYPDAKAEQIMALPEQRWTPPATSGLTAAARECSLVTLRAADVSTKSLDWLWPGRIALGKLTLIAGDPGLGKSLLTAELAARVSRGLHWPADGSPCPRGEALLISGEDQPADTIRPRLEAAGADLAQVHLVSAVSVSRAGAAQGLRALSLHSDQHALAAFLAAHPRLRLVCIDPISAYLGATDSYRNADVRALLQPLAELAEQAGVAIIAISHLTKSGSSAVHRVSGSLAFVAAARASYIVAKDRADPRRRLILPSKNNLGQDTTGIAYTIASAPNGAPRIEWESGAVAITADEALSAGSDAQRSERSEAAEWLLEVLREGAVPAKQLRQEAARAGIAWHAVHRVRQSTGAVSRRIGFGRDATYVWQMQGADKAPTP